MLKKNVQELKKDSKFIYLTNSFNQILVTSLTLLNLLSKNLSSYAMQHHEHSNSSDSSKSQNIDIQESDSNMNEDQQALFLDIRKSRSNDSFLGPLIGTTREIQKRPLVLNLDDFKPQPISSSNNENQNLFAPLNMSIFKKVKKQKKHNKCDYQKNICGYITKKIIREFTGLTFEDFVEELCKKYYCNSDSARKWYVSRVENITGPSHLPTLLKPQVSDSQETIRSKFAFREFFEWFLKERYLRYLLLEGKMSDKKAYIEFKNKVLFGFLEEDRVEIDKMIVRLLDTKKQQELEVEMHRLKSLSSRSKSRDKNIILTQRMN